MNESDQLQFTKIHDSLVSTGNHGYYTTVFIVGRIKIAPLFEDNPFEIKISKIAPELLKDKINFIILDSISYSITYNKYKVEKTLRGAFDKKLHDENIQLLISKIRSFNDSISISTLKNIDYLLEVNSY